jgi:DNA-directed RNA polymerase subunit L
MKKVLFSFLILALGLLLFYPFAPGSALSKIQSDLKTIGETEADYRQALSQKLEEVERYEDMIDRVTSSFENAAANAPICPKTGRQIEIVMDKDPRPALREKCDVLWAEIEEIEKKLGE